MVAQFAQMGLAGLQGWLSGSLNKANVNAANKVSRANAEAGNMVRASQNTLSAASTALARYRQSSNNNNQLDYAGEGVEAIMVNASRMEQQALTGSFEDSIRDAEQRGIAAASAGWSGAGGSVVDDVNVATSLRSLRAMRSAQDAGDIRMYDLSRKVAGVYEQVVGGLDQNAIYDNVDYNQSVAKQQYAPSPWVGAILSAVGTGMQNGGLSELAQTGQSFFKSSSPTGGSGITLDGVRSNTFSFSQQSNSMYSLR